eukprot:SAG31_NODE_26899_length_434_cov_1.226866_1_plen_144_part_11
MDGGETFEVYHDNTQAIEHMCIPPGVHTFSYFNTHGNGWNGGFWEILSENGEHIAGGATNGIVSGYGGEAAFALQADGSSTAAVPRTVTVHVSVGSSRGSLIMWGIDGEALYPDGVDPYTDSSDYYTELSLSEGLHTMNTIGGL